MYGTFTKNEQTRLAYTPVEAVQLCAEGWQRTSDAPVDTTAAVLEVEVASGSPAVSVPPRGGAGSGRDAWADYASAHNVDVADDASRDDIINALDEVGIPTE